MLTLVQLNVRGRDMGSFVNEARDALDAQLKLPAGYSLQFSGQYENQIHARKRLQVVVPLVLITSTASSAKRSTTVSKSSSLIALSVFSMRIAIGCWPTAAPVEASRRAERRRARAPSDFHVESGSAALSCNDVFHLHQQTGECRHRAPSRSSRRRPSRMGSAAQRVRCSPFQSTSACPATPRRGAIASRPAPSSQRRSRAARGHTLTWQETARWRVRSSAGLGSLGPTCSAR